MATSVTHHGITWTFSTDRTVGAFVNGEPYVVGPVTITDIDPHPEDSEALGNGTAINTSHGSMKNPVPGSHHGFEANITGFESTMAYQSSLNVALSLPISLANGDVLVSCRGRGNAYPDYIQTMAALTVVASPPAAGSFRPGIYGASGRGTFRNISAVNPALLPNITAPASTPSKADILALLPDLPWFEWSNQWYGNHLQGIDNGVVNSYGREVAWANGIVGLWLCTNQSEADKMEVLARWVQRGIDIHAYVTALGGNSGFYHDGGHKCGRKLPLAMAAYLTGDSDLSTLASNPNVFQEDTQTWTVNSDDVDRIVYDHSPDKTYQLGDVGEAEWGVRHRYEPFYDDRRVAAGYRTVVWPAMAPAGIALEVLGEDFQTLWNHPPLRNYHTRWMMGAGYDGDLPALPGGSWPSGVNPGGFPSGMLSDAFPLSMWAAGGGWTPVPSAPSNSSVPTISGFFNVGQTIVGYRGTWSGYPSPTYAYQWQRGTSDISGATTINYVATESDLGNTLRLKVTASNSEGSVAAYSTSSSSVAGELPPSPTFSSSKHITPTTVS